MKEDRPSWSKDDESAEASGMPPRYRLSEICGQGGFATVWRATDQKLGRDIAVKRLNERLARDPEARQRFVREARLTSRLEHPGIVPIYDLLDDAASAGPQYLMKLVRGETLAETIAEYHNRRQTADERRARLRSLLSSFVAVARTMEFAHARGVLHRDLKPQNIIVGEFGETIILDWGLARTRLDSAEEQTGVGVGFDDSPLVTQPGTVQGTPAYMAPEQASGRCNELDERTDVYALGVILYELLTGETPFSGQTADDVQQRAMDEEAVSPRRRNPSVPRALAAICLKALARLPSLRYQSVRELREDIERALADEPVAAHREMPWERTLRWVRAHRALTLAVAVSLGATCIVLLAALALITGSRARESAARQEADRQRDEARKQARLADQRLNHVLRETYNLELVRARDLWRTEPARTLAALDDERRCPTAMRDFAWGLYHHLSERKRWSQSLNHGFLSAIALSPDHRIVAVGGEDGVIRLLDASSGRMLREWSSQGGWVTDLLFQTRANAVLSANADGTIRQWSVPNGQPTRTVKAHESHVNAIAISRDESRLASGGADGKLKTWSLADGGLIQETAAHDGELSDLAMIGDSIASVGEDGDVRIWDRDLNPLRTLSGHESSVQAVVALDAGSLATADLSGVIILWDAAGGERMRLNAHTDRVGALSFSAQRHELVSASWDQTVRVWDTATGQLKVTLAGHESAVLTSGFASDGSTLLSGDRNGLVISWITSPDACRAAFDGGPVPLAIGFLAGKNQLLLAGGDPLLLKPGGYLHLWDFGAETGHKSLGDFEKTVTSLAVSADGRLAAAGSSDQLVHIWDLESRREIRRLGPHGGYVWSVALSPDRSLLASAGGDKRIRVWNSQTGELLNTLEGHAAAVQQVAFDSSGKRLASADWDRTVIVWSIDDGREIWRLSPKSKDAALLAFAANGYLIAAYRENSLAAWLPPDPQPVAEFRGHSARINAICLSPDQRCLASGDEKGVVRLWDPERGQERAMFQAHSRPISSIGFATDSRILASADAGGSVKLWQSASRSP